ncbi:hypothetical protein DSUL_40013 [Desulfovibrionales bacterium]
MGTAPTATAMCMILNLNFISQASTFDKYLTGKYHFFCYHQTAYHSRRNMLPPLDLPANIGQNLVSKHGGLICLQLLRQVVNNLELKKAMRSK